MPFINAIRIGFLNYLNYKSRARRSDFWYWVLFGYVGALAISNLDTSVGRAFSLIIMLPNIMFGIRRMHDVDRSGWWLLLPIVNIIFWAKSGTEGENRFGPPPPPAFQ